MTAVQKIIKYCAIGLAVLIILSMIGGIFGILSLFAKQEGEPLLEPRKLLEAEDGYFLKSIDVELFAVSLNVVSGDKLKVETNSRYISCEYSDNRLVVREEERPLKAHFSCAGWVAGKEEILTLTLPMVSAPERVDLKAGAGNIDIDFLIADYIDFEFGAGDISLCDLKIHGANIRGGAGKMTLLSSEIQNLSLEMGVGALVLEASLFGNNKINCGVGQVEITLLGAPESYKVKIQRGVGSVDVNGLTGNGDVYGNGDNLIEISGGVGSISVKFLK
jgi:hypothetical protein